MFRHRISHILALNTFNTQLGREDVRIGGQILQLTLIYSVEHWSKAPLLNLEEPLLKRAEDLTEHEHVVLNLENID